MFPHPTLKFRKVMDRLRINDVKLENEKLIIWGNMYIGIQVVGGTSGCNSAKKLIFFKLKVATFPENISTSHP
jgi:hypothetical protein